MTILFADVTGSTELGERLDAERLREVMDAFFAAMREEIEAEGGTVEKFIGDAVMAAFGVPVVHEDDPARALRAAHRMRRRLGRLNQELTSSHGVELSMRLGVNTGEVLAVTAPKPGEAMVTGDAVNAAARLEQAAEPGQVLVGERTARAARGFRFREAGPLEVKGKSQPVSAFLLLVEEKEEEPAPAELERGIPGIRAPLVGRDAEMDLLSSLSDRVVSEGRPHLVTIYGDPGVGKSRLVAEFVARVEEQQPSPTVVRGRCLPYGEGVTFWPVAEILKGLAGVLDTDPPELALKKIGKLGREFLTPEVATDPRRATAALAFTVGIEDPSIVFRDLPPREVQTETHAAWRSFFSALSKERPLVVIVEDIHWAGSAMLDLLDDLAEHVEGPVMFVCPTRPELTDRQAEWGGGKRNFSSISLLPLSAAESERLVGLLVAVEDLPEQLRRRILDRAEGNPFFLEEIVRQLVDEGRLVPEDGRWRITGDLVDIAIPDTIQAVLAARIDLLQQDDKRALQFAAVVGRVFWPGPVEILLGRTEGLEDTLDRLERKELVLSRLGSSMAGQREYIFKHVLTRDVAFESLPRRERAAAHRLLAGWIEDTVGERKLEFVELLAHHFVEAYRLAVEGPRILESRRGAGEAAGTVDLVEELRRKALEYLLLASEDARWKSALKKAIHLAEQAVELAQGDVERAVALEALGEAYNFDYQGDLAWEQLTRAIDTRLSGVPDDRRAIADLCGRATEIPLRWTGTMKKKPEESDVRKYLEIGLEHAGEGDSDELARLLAVRAFSPWAAARQRRVTEEERREAIADGERAAEMALRLGRPALASGALDAVAGVHLSEGLSGAALRVTERRLALLPALERDPSEVGDMYSVLAWHHCFIGRYRDALAHATEGFERTKQFGTSGALHSLAWGCIARVRLGDWDGFFADFARIQEILGDRSADPPGFAARPFAAAAFIHEVQGNRVAADRFLSIVAKSDEREEIGATARDAWVAMVRMRRGELEDPLARLWKPQLETWKEALPPIMEARCDFLAEAGGWEEVATFLEGARAFAREAGLLALPFFADRLEGRAALAAGRRLVAENTLKRAAEGFASLEAAWEEARTRLYLAEALLTARRIAEAREEIEKAYPVFERLQSVKELARCRELLAREGLSL
ncbi:MAG TPA: adenylate/guanylate cyclase domain-containing protein [Actinomycetota bacterium]|nr:adenylate/guanylate cyclase domain-containing protein [Actinomycetota bacterium]